MHKEFPYDSYDHIHPAETIMNNLTSWLNYNLSDYHTLWDVHKHMDEQWEIETDHFELVPVFNEVPGTEGMPSVRVVINAVFSKMKIRRKVDLQAHVTLHNRRGRRTHGRSVNMIGKKANEKLGVLLKDYLGRACSEYIQFTNDTEPVVRAFGFRVMSPKKYAMQLHEYVHRVTPNDIEQPSQLSGLIADAIEHLVHNPEWVRPIARRWGDLRTSKPIQDQFNLDHFLVRCNNSCAPDIVHGIANMLTEGHSLSQYEWDACIEHGVHLAQIGVMKEQSDDDTAVLEAADRLFKLNER